MLSSLPGEATAVLAATQALPFGVAITDTQGNVTFANAVYAQLTGCTPDQLVGHSAGEFDWKALEQAAPSSEPWRGQAVCLRKTGEAYSVEHSITALRDPAGEVSGFWIMKRDATELKRPAGTPYQAEANLSALIESTDDLIASFDLEYRLLTFNKALAGTIARIVGVKAVSGMRLEEWLPAQNIALWPPMLDRVLSEGPFRAEYSLVDGRTAELSFNPILHDGETIGISVFGKDITERKTAEKALREAESKYRNIFDNALEGIYRNTLQGRCLDANTTLATMLGYDSAVEFIATVTDVAHQVWLDPNDRLRCLQLLEPHGFVRGYESKFKRKDGTAVWVSVNIRRVGGPDDQTAYYEGFIEDISDRKKTAIALHKSEETFAKVFLCSPAVMVLTDADCGDRLLEVSEAFVRVTGYRREDAIGRSIRELDLWSDPREFDNYRNHMRTDGRVRSMEFHFHRRNGELATGLISGESIELDGKRCRIAAILDITERRNAEKQYRDIFEGAQEGIYRTSMERKFVAANPALAKMLGYDSPQELLSTITDTEAQLWRDPSDRSRFAALLAERGRVRGFECQLKRKNGTPLWVSISARRVSGPDGRPLFYDGFVQDITERKQMQDALRKSQETFAIAFRSNPVMTTVFRPDEKGNWIVNVNEAFEQNTGYRREELVGHTSQELGFWADPVELDEAMNKLRVDGRVRNFKYHFRKKTGEIRTGLLSTDSIELGGTVCGISATVDITEQEKAEQKLQQANEAVAKAERHYRRLFNSISDSVVVFKLEEDGLTSHVSDANDNACHFLGYTREELLRLRVVDIDAPENHLNAPAIVSDLLTKGHCISEQEIIANDGRRLPVEINTHVFDLDGSPTMISCVRDISERKEAERQYREIFEGAQEGIYRTSMERKFVAANSSMARILGYASPQELVSTITDTNVELWLDPNDRTRCAALLDENGSVRGVECQLKRKDGSALWASINARIVYGADGRPLYYDGFVQDITERRRMQDALQKSAETFAKLFRSSPTTTILFKLEETEYRIADVNEAFEQRTGYRREEVTGRTIEGLGLWADPSEGLEYLTRFRNSGRVNSFEHGFRRKNGDTGVCLSSIESVEIDGSPCAIAATIDITDQKKAERALKQANEAAATAERHYRLMFNSVSDAILVHKIGADGLPSHFREVNDNACRYLGYTREELLQMGPSDIDAPEERADIPVRIQKICANGHLMWQGTHITKDGQRVPVEVNTHLVDLDGLQTLISCVRDISERRKAEGTMKTLMTAIEQANETIVITALDGTIQYCNPAFEKITGYSKEEAIGQNPRVLKSGKHSNTFYEQMWATIIQGNVWTGQLTNKKKDGSFYEEDATISPIHETSGKLSGFVAVKRDVTERIQLEDQLRQAQKLESVGRLAGGVAHDFNNLLTVINGYSGFLLRELKADDPAHEYAEEIKIAGERAASLTKQLLAFSRKQVIEPKLLDLNAIIRESTVMLGRLIGDDIVLETHLDDLLGQVMADPDQIHQVIMNLAVNARDAMPNGGALDIETLNVVLGKEDGPGGHPERNPGRYVLMTVTDCGQGMDPSIQKDIFEPFFTTKGVGKGTGLGLSTVYGIMRQNGGWIDVWSEVGVGTTFKMYLPRIDACAVEEEEMSFTVGGGGETILLVEDQEAVRSFAKAALRQQGYQVIHAGDGDQALSVAKQHLEQIDLLVTDVVMPRMNGRELSGRLRALYPHLKVLFISGYTADVLAQRGVLDPGVSLLHKPFSQEELAQRVREVLDRLF
jgi:PAS domain S-box-containing protein